MLTIHRAERADVLADALAELLLDAPGGSGGSGRDPFAPEVVAVPTRGIERWLSQRLSAWLGAAGGQADGVCANVLFPSPGRLVADALALASGIAPEQDPWRAERLVWPLIGVVDDALHEPWLEPLARHLLADGRQRYDRLARLAQLFDAYAVYRPELVQAWARGESGGIGAGDAGAWQVELWRRLRTALATPSVAERLDGARARLAEQPELVGLPDRFALFGVTRLPASHLAVLRALAVRRDVHLMLLHPSAELWTRGRADNRLLASWGRDIRGLQELLGEHDADVHHPLARRGDETPTGTLLDAIQAHIRANRQPPGPPLRDRELDRRMAPRPDDRSIRIHACHGRARQVEVLRDAILHRLEQDPTLEPRDVIVMCPDIEAFAPLIEASFGERAGAPVASGPPALRVRLADRSLRRTTPILAVVARLLELASSRVTASEVLDLADSAPVRARFELGDEDLAQAREWVAAAGIHWGLDAPARERYRLASVAEGTWAEGLRRLLLGVAVSPDAHSLFAGVPAVAEISSSEVTLVGRLCELLDRLQATLASLQARMPLAGWASAIQTGVELLTLTPPRDAWQRQQLDEILAETIDTAGQAPVPLSLGEVRALLARRLEGRPTRASFRSGHLTFCTLVPMRSVPHRLVCLLGLDDGTFPRQGAHDGDNLLLAAPRPGDRDPRSEDRQLLLDALMAAREGLIVTYSGNDERTNAPLPPAVPVGELLDMIDATAQGVRSGVRPGPGGAAAAPPRARDAVVIHHPLQSFDPRNFRATGSGPARAGFGPWSFEQAALDGARALVAPRHAPPGFLPVPLPPSPAAQLFTLAELVAFVQRPVRAFLRQRLGIAADQAEDEVSDALPIELDALARWGVGQRLLEAVLEGAEPRDAVLAEIARGTLPPGALGRPVVEALWPDVRALAAAARAYQGAAGARTVATNLMLDDGMRMTGSVGQVRDHALVSVSYSRLHPRGRLAAWIRLLALSAAEPEVQFEAVTIGRGEHPGSVAVARLPQLALTPAQRRETALSELTRLARLRATGLCAPLPVPCASAHAYARALAAGEDPVAAADGAWRSRFGHVGEDAEPEHRLALGPELDLERLGALATAIWQPLLARERLEWL